MDNEYKVSAELDAYITKRIDDSMRGMRSMEQKRKRCRLRNISRYIWLSIMCLVLLASAVWNIYGLILLIKSLI